jgi:hypothetical protein
MCKFRLWRYDETTSRRSILLMSQQLMRGKRNFTRTAVHAAPRPFLFIALNKSGSARMVTHVVRLPSLLCDPINKIQNDQFFISHRHQAEDGLPNLEDLTAKEPPSDDGASMSSVVHTPPFVKRKPQTVLFTIEVGPPLHMHYKTLMTAGPCPAHLPHGGCQDQFGSTSVSAQHCRLHEAASSRGRRYLCTGHAPLQHIGTVSRCRTYCSANAD